MEEPIESSLKNAEQLEVAKLQDDTIQMIADNTNAILHGGTAIWRCYGGKRFSEDIDLYLHKETDIKKLANRVAQSRLRIAFNRERKGTVYYDIANDRTNISLQIKIAKKKRDLALYEKINGIKLVLYSLSPEVLIVEKIDAYYDRRFIRDIYDIMILTKYATDKDYVIKQLNRFISNLQKPKDENILKSLVYSGPIPSFADIVAYLKRWCLL